MENKEKSMFQEARMKLKLTRNRVADLSDGFFNESRLEKIETGKLEIHPEEVVKLSDKSATLFRVSFSFIRAS